MRSGRHAQPHRFINGGLRIGDELFQISVVGFLRIADDGNEALSISRSPPTATADIAAAA